MAASASRISKLLLFYFVFYSVLAIFTAALFKLFLITLDDKEPKWQQDKSLIGNTPAVSVKPNVFFGTFGYNARSEVFGAQWKYLMDIFFEPYYRRSECGPGACYVEEDSAFGPCSKIFDYGLNDTRSGPCIFLKLNKIYGWKPEFYHSFENLPSNMPNELVESIKFAESRREKNMIWVDCKGASSTDSENLGYVSYYPQRGFDEKYFPYTNEAGYMSPVVAVYFINPKREVPIKIECRVWAPNIYHDIKNNKGAIGFSFIVY